MKSFTSLSIFEIFEFFLVSFFFSDGSFVGSMFVIRLINCDEWGIDGIVHDEGA